MGAHGSEEEATFLATQQVDEARHMQFYGRVQDEHRHIGYGTWFLREAVRGDQEAADVVRQTLRDLLPAAADSLRTPDGADAGALGATTDELRGFALSGLTRRLAIIGVPLASLEAPGKGLG